MCLAIPAKIIELCSDNLAIVDLAGVQKEISISLVDGVKVGDYVIVHVGYALQIVNEEEAKQTLSIFAKSGILEEARIESLGGV